MNLRSIVKVAELEASKLSFCLQDIERRLVFWGFNDEDQPQVSICEGDEIILVYKGSKIHSSTFIKIMEKRGHITKEDFKL